MNSEYLPGGIQRAIATEILVHTVQYSCIYILWFVSGPQSYKENNCGNNKRARVNRKFGPTSESAERWHLNFALLTWTHNNIE